MVMIVIDGKKDEGGGGICPIPIPRTEIEVTPLGGAQRDAVKDGILLQ